jgi:hypothetical protein
VEAGHDSRHLGEEGGPVVPAGQDLPQAGHRRGGLRFGGFVPAGVPLDDAVQLGDDQPVAVRPGTILSHLAMIERGYGKSELARSVYGVPAGGVCDW